MTTRPAIVVLDDRLRNAIDASGFKQKYVAEQVGISPPVLSQIVNGRCATWPKVRGRLAAFLGIDEVELFGEPS